jgi:hypothetical protein
VSPELGIVSPELPRYCVPRTSNGVLIFGALTILLASMVLLRLAAKGIVRLKRGEGSERSDVRR